MCGGREVDSIDVATYDDSPHGGRMLPLSDLHDVESVYRYAATEMTTSPVYEAWALGVADDPEALRVLGTLPPAKQQANLVFAAARRHGLEPGPYDDLRALLLGSAWPDVRATVLERRTQTNEVGRLTALVPALGLLGEGPFALVELGSSAGLCLHPDRFDYEWDGVGALSGAGRPVLSTRASGPVPIPERHPRIAARIGVDLHPLDPRDDDAAEWLLTLVWPGQDERRERLAAALEVVRREPPVQVLVGDMIERLDGALGLAEASGGVPVVQHSVAVAYLEEDDRRRLEARLRTYVDAGRCHWISLEGPRVLSEVEVPDPVVSHRMLLAVDGRAVAWAHGHGADLAWL